MTEKDGVIRLGSSAEDLFIDLLSEVFGPENTRYIIIRYPFADIYGKQNLGEELKDIAERNMR